MDGAKGFASTDLLPTCSTWPIFGSDEVAAVRSVLESGKVNYWTGQECRAFETEFATYFNADHAIAVANGTVALELALMAAGIGSGDEVIVPPRTFIASASAAVRVGAAVKFADIDPDTQAVTHETIAAVLSPRTRALIVVHLGGQPCEMEPILRLARDHGLVVIEDCAQAHGALYKDRFVGTLGDIAAFSFCQDKIMTTGGEGGMILTNDTAYWRMAWSLKDHGKSPEAVSEPNDGATFRWVHERCGTNARMTEMQAAIGRTQLKKLPQWLEQRRRNAAELSAALQGTPALRIPALPAHTRSAWYKFYAFVRPEQLPPMWSRDRIVRQLRNAGVPCGSGSCSEVYREKAFSGSAYAPAARLPIAKQLGETSLMFPVDPTLGEASMREIGRCVKSLFNDILSDVAVPEAEA